MPYKVAAKALGLMLCRVLIASASSAARRTCTLPGALSYGMCGAAVMSAACTTVAVSESLGFEGSVATCVLDSFVSEGEFGPGVLSDSAKLDNMVEMWIEFMTVQLRAYTSASCCQFSDLVIAHVKSLSGRGGRTGRTVRNFFGLPALVPAAEAFVRSSYPFFLSEAAETVVGNGDGGAEDAAGAAVAVGASAVAVQDVLSGD